MKTANRTSRWEMLARIGAGFALMALVAGCAADTSTVSGNELGGKVPYAEGQVPAAMRALEAYCAKFGKKGAIIRMTPASEGGEIGFDCR